MSVPPPESRSMSAPSLGQEGTINYAMELLDGVRACIVALFKEKYDMSEECVHRAYGIWIKSDLNQDSQTPVLRVSSKFAVISCLYRSNVPDFLVQLKLADSGSVTTFDVNNANALAKLVVSMQDDYCKSNPTMVPFYIMGQRLTALEEALRAKGVAIPYMKQTFLKEIGAVVLDIDNEYANSNIYYQLGKEPTYVFDIMQACVPGHTHKVARQRGKTDDVHILANLLARVHAGQYSTPAPTTV